MLSFDRLDKQERHFMRLLGMKLKDFLAIVEKTRSSWEEMQRGKKLPGRSSRIKTLEDEILLALIYHRFHIGFIFLGYLFNLDASNVYRHLRKIEPMLAKTLETRGDRKMSEKELSEIILDVAEIQISRPSREQRTTVGLEKKCNSTPEKSGAQRQN